MEGEGTARHLLVFHLVAAALAALLLAIGGLALRHALWLAVLTYNLALPVYFYRRGDLEVVRIWAFVLPLSALQVIPDWYLCEVQGTLSFPTARGPFPVPLFMAGLWTWPLVMTTAAGVWFDWQIGRWTGYLAALGLGLFLFGGGELALTSIGVWRALDVTTVGGLALYILPAELLLTVATLYAYRQVRDQSPWRRLVAAPLVMMFYLGAATTAYLLVESSGVFF